MEVSGRVVKRPVAAGSKSERHAVCLETGDTSYILRRKHGHPFSDDQLEKLVGKQICADGSIIGGGTFLMSDWSEVE
jgi:hypothetical protein